MSKGNLSRLLKQAIIDPEVKDLLFDRASEAAAVYELGERGRKMLMRLSRAHFDTIVGSLFVHKLLPVRLGSRFSIIPTLANGRMPPGRIPIQIDQSRTGGWASANGTVRQSGVAFGSGRHPTTALCVYALERHLKSGASVLDLGTGSGILAIVAAKLGAAEVLALDVDPHAIRVAEANVCRNDLEDVIQLFVGDPNWLRGNGKNHFDVIVSNILAEVHGESLRGGLVESMRPGGYLVLSGMSKTGAVRVAKTLQQENCQIIDHARMGPWVVLVARLMSSDEAG